MTALHLQEKETPIASPLATLEERTTQQAAQAPAPQGVRTGLTLTGQYLYDRFIENNDEDITIMGLVRGWTKTVDVASFKKALKDFIAIAKEHGETKLKTAQNHQTVMRQAYGAIRFAMPQLESLGYTERTGYLAMRVMGKKALEARGLKWDGSKAEPRLEADVRERHKVEKLALEAVKAKNPQLPTESIVDWHKRVLADIDTEAQAIIKERQKEHVEKLAEKVKDLCGDSLKDVLEMLLDNFELADDEAPM